RVESGLYDDVFAEIVGLDKTGLAGVDYPEDFTRVVEAWPADMGNLKFVNRKGGEFRFTLFGEIQNPSQGTCLRAQGNHFHREGEKFTPINDSSKIKDTIAIGVPTLSSIEMDNLFRNQTVPLINVYSAVAAEDAALGRNPFVKKCTKARDGGDGEHDIIVVTMLPKYQVPPTAGAPKVAKRAVKRKLDDSDGANSSQETPGETVYPSDIYVGAHYPPSLLSDYAGDYFQHQAAKLVQLDVRYSDQEETIIPPWDNYDVLKPGTLILALCTLHCFIYQLNAHSIKVADVSDEVVEPRLPPVPPNSVGRLLAAMPARSAS
ncbi:hypothetical protein C8R43DRAFT_821679, partial [Mycena crocata]